MFENSSIVSLSLLCCCWPSCTQSISNSTVVHVGKTRTCIYTEAPTFGPGELEAQTADILKDAELVYFDGWLTESAVSLARAARKAGIQTLLTPSSLSSCVSSEDIA